MIWVEVWEWFISKLIHQICPLQLTNTRSATNNNSKLSRSQSFTEISSMFYYSLKFFQVCGFYPIRIGKFVGKSRTFSALEILLGFWSLLHVTSVSIIIIYVAIFNDYVLYAVTPIGKFNDILVLFSLFFAHLVIVIESFVKRRFYIKYWNFFEKLQRIGKRQIKRKWHGFMFKKLVIFFIFSIIVELLVITNIDTDRQWTTFW